MATHISYHPEDPLFSSDLAFMTEADWFALHHGNHIAESIAATKRIQAKELLILTKEKKFDNLLSTMKNVKE